MLMDTLERELWKLYPDGWEDSLKIGDRVNVPDGRYDDFDGEDGTIIIENGVVVKLFGWYWGKE